MVKPGPLRVVPRLCRRLRRSYVLICAKEDCRRLGLRIPNGIWHCGPCGHTFLDGPTFTRHSCTAGAGAASPGT